MAAVETDMMIIGLATKRGGICLRSELSAAGLTAGMIDHRIRAGMLRPVGRGLYCVDHLADWSTRLHRATQLVPASIVSHLSAAWVHRQPVEWSITNDPVHVITGNGYSRRIEGIRAHPRRRPVDPDDIVVIGGVPVTGPARTIVDLASMVGRARLRHVIQTQMTTGAVELEEVEACFSSLARRGVTGASRLRTVLVDLADGDAVPQSVLEEALAALLKAHDICGFEAQYRPPWYDGWRGVADFAHPHLRLVLEADGRKWHQRDQDMTEDRRRDRLAARHGWQTIRVTWAEVNHRPGAIVSDLKAIIRCRAA